MDFRCALGKTSNFCWMFGLDRILVIVDAYMWDLFGVKYFKYLYFERSGIEKSGDWLINLDES